MAKRHFSVDEADALLPTLEGHLRRLQGLRREAVGLVEEMERIKAIGNKLDGTLIMAYDYRLAEERFRSIVEEAQGVIDAIRTLGCELRDIDKGLVDFPAVVDGEEVYLCWRLGEREVGYYHRVHDGFAGRRPLSRRRTRS